MEVYYIVVISVWHHCIQVSVSLPNIRHPDAILFHSGLTFFGTESLTTHTDICSRIIGCECYTVHQINQRLFNTTTLTVPAMVRESSGMGDCTKQIKVNRLCVR